MSASQYDGPWIHSQMLSDTVRCEAFRAAVRAAVRPGDVVLDVGAGTGILSLFAVEAGAGTVYAIERSRASALLADVVRRNGAAERVLVVPQDVESASLPGKVDVIVSEWLGTYGVDEGMLPAVLVARDRWLKPGGRLVPARVTAWLAPVLDARLEREVGFLRATPYGRDLGPVADALTRVVHYNVYHLSANDLLGEPREMWTTDAATCPIEEARRPYTARATFRATRDGSVNALTAWFTADLHGGIALTDAPGKPDTHWATFLAPFDRTVQVRDGEEIDAELSFQATSEGRLVTSWAVRVGSGAWERHGPAEV